MFTAHAIGASLVNAIGAGEGRSDAFDMHEVFTLQTLVNLQLLGSERFTRDVLGLAQVTGEKDDINSTCSTVQSTTGILLPQRACG